MNRLAPPGHDQTHQDRIQLMRHVGLDQTQKGTTGGTDTLSHPPATSPMQPPELLQ
jgi:hypothetical protein